jgi:hypothetical protein
LPQQPSPLPWPDLSMSVNVPTVCNDGQRHAPGNGTRYPLYRRRGGLQGRSGQVRKISPPPGFDAPTAQSVPSHNTDWAIATYYPQWALSEIILSPFFLYVQLTNRILEG